MNYKSIIKLIIPQKLWFFIRQYFIVFRHTKVARSLKYLIDDCETGKLQIFKFKKKVNLPQNGKIIWQYWAQGYDRGTIPELAEICLTSVEKYSSGYKLIRLSDENITDYIDIPDFILAKKNIIPLGQYADLLRLMLLYTYGGVWLDACVLLTGELPTFIQNIKKGDFFMFQRDSKEPHKNYWENSFAYYFGWYKGFKVNVLNGIMCANIGNKVIEDLCTMLLNYWKTHDRILDYFFFQIMFDIYINRNPNRNCLIVNDCIPHMLRQIINAEYPYKSTDDVLEQTSIHSLSYKNPYAASRLKEILHFNS